MDEHYDLRVTGSFKIGRSPLCNITLSDSHVSKVHCSLNICSQGDAIPSASSKFKVLITDHSSNGTWIFSKSSKESLRLEKEKPTLLKEGDIILLTRSTDIKCEVIAYKYLQSPFPKVIKSTYHPDEYLNQGTAALSQGKEKDAQIYKETAKRMPDVSEEDDGSKAVGLDKPDIETSSSITGSSDSKKCMVTDSLKTQRDNIETNDLEKVGNTSTFITPSHSAPSVSSHGSSSPKICIRQDDVNTCTPHLKRKNEADQYTPVKKVRFKEQIEENLEHHKTLLGSSSKSDDLSMDFVDTRVERNSPNGTSFGVNGKGSCATSTNTLKDTSPIGNGLGKACGKVEVKTHTTTSLTMRESSDFNPSSAEVSSRLSKYIEVKQEGDSHRKEEIAQPDKVEQTTGVDAFADDSLYGECVHCGKRIPHLTISLHEVICEGHSQETKSQDHVSLSSLPLESCVFADVRNPDVGSSGKCETSGDESEGMACRRECEQSQIEIEQTRKVDSEVTGVETCSKNNHETSQSLPSVPESHDELEKCTESEIITTSAVTSCKSDEKIEESTVATLSGSTEQHEVLQGSPKDDSAFIPPLPNPPTLEKEESKERCTFCSALLPLPELVLHVSACSKTSAVTDTDSDNPESIQEACPYCASYFDVLALVEHVDYCKNLSMNKAEEISREDCSPSSDEECGSDYESSRVEDHSMSDKELCPKCSGEFSLLELFEHADKCKGETPETSPGLNSLRSGGHDHLDADDDSEKIVNNKSRVSRTAGNKDVVGSDVRFGKDDDENSDSGDDRRTNEDDNITRGDGDHDSNCSDEENSICKGKDAGEVKDKGDFDDKKVGDDDNAASGDHDIRLTDDESSMCSDDEVSARKGQTSDDKHVDVMETSKKGADTDEFELCPSCGKLFHLSHLIEHASNCTSVLSVMKKIVESKATGYGASSSPETSTAAPTCTVFSDCSLCGIRLSPHMMMVHYPKCRKHFATKSNKSEVKSESEGFSQPEQRDPGVFPEHGGYIANLSSRVTVDDKKIEKHPASTMGDSSTSSEAKMISSTDDSKETDEFKAISLKRTLSSLDSYQDCEEQCMYCLKMFAVSVLVEHVSVCATLNKAATEELEQCCYCLQNFPLSELINHAENCEQKTASSSQEDSQDKAATNSQSSRELLERCMYCFKDFPVSKLIRHSQRCDGDMSGPRERFQGFLPSVHDLSAVSSVAILNDNQRAALQYVISRSAQDSKKVSSGLLTRVKGLGYSESDLTRTLQWIRSAAPIIIHINLDKVLRFLVDDTHYRNQFETGTSGGSTDLRARSSWEDRIFNSFYQRSRPSERVKYGVLNIVGDPRGVKSCVHYGDSFLQLKKVRLRTTFASMDTSGAGVKLSCCEHYENVLFAYSDPEIKAIIDVATGKVPFHRSDCISQYKEVQIHGPVSLSENVECIVVNARHQGDSRMESLLDRFVEQNKCNLIWMDPIDLTGPAPPLFGAFGHYPTAEFLTGGLGRRGGARGHTKSKRARR